MPKRTEGSQTVARIGKVLDVLSKSNSPGERLSRIAERCGLGKATAHRLLTALADIGFVEQNAATKLYCLGLVPFSIGAAAASRVNIIGFARDSVERLANSTGDTVFLAVRNNYDAVVVDRLSGAFPVKAQTQNIGDRLPLGASCGGLAILSSLADAEVRKVLEHNAGRLADFAGVDLALLLRHVEATRKRGFAVYEGQIVSGMTAVGMAITDQRASANAAISIVAMSSRMREPRRLQIVNALRQEIARIDQRVAPLARAHAPR